MFQKLGYYIPITEESVFVTRERGTPADAVAAEKDACMLYYCRCFIIITQVADAVTSRKRSTETGESSSLAVKTNNYGYLST